jgi:hypothetical protein
MQRIVGIGRDLRIPWHQVKVQARLRRFAMADERNEQSRLILRGALICIFDRVFRLLDGWIDKKAAAIKRGDASAPLGIGHDCVKIFRRLWQERQVSQCLALRPDDQDAPLSHSLPAAGPGTLMSSRSSRIFTFTLPPANKQGKKGG